MRTFLINHVFPLIPQGILNRMKIRRWEKQYREWLKNNCPVPPPHIVKQYAIREYQEVSKYDTLIETGTYLGDMVEAQKNQFKKIISIEISNELFEKAKKRFRNDKNVTIVEGDSGIVLPQIMKDMDEPVIFWLDGHYSGGVTKKGNKNCPIYEELDAVFSGKPLEHILLIDDARHFAGRDDYPTIEELTQYIRQKNEKYQVEIKHDIIRCVIP